MSKQQLETLFRLQTIDHELLARQREVERYEGALAERRRAMDALDARLEEMAVERKALVNERALAERRIQQQQDSLRQKRGRLQRVRNERELRAGEDEVRIQEAEIGEEETRLLEQMGKVEEVEGRISEARSELDALKDADHKQIEEMAADIDKLRAELEAIRKDRDVIASELDGSMRSKYDLILSRRDGVAVVKVVEGCCGGCHMHVPPQTLIEVMKTGVVRVCPTCNRILYITPPEEEAQAEEATG